MSVFAGEVPLSSGRSIPQVGLGMLKISDDEAQRVVEDAIQVGYRHIDTAASYGNERGVGAALRASGLPRDDVFVTSKLRNGDQGYDSALRAYDDTVARLGLERVDLYLVHWPNPSAGLWQESWRALERLVDEGRVGAIGVSNFLPEHLHELTTFAQHLPVVNQIEVNPGFQQRAVIETCRGLGIAVEAYSPLGRGAALTAPVVEGLAERLGVTPAQVVVRWHVQHGRVVIPKSVNRDRMATNLSVQGFHLDDQAMAAVDALESGQRTGRDPLTFSGSQFR